MTRCLSFALAILMIGVRAVSASAASPLPPNTPAPRQETLPCNLREFVDVIEPIQIPPFTPTPTVVDRAKDHVVTSLLTKGDEIDGPQRIVLLYLNKWRYSFSSSVDVTIIQNPTVPAGFVATELAKGITTPSGGGDTSPIRVTAFDRTFELIRRCVAMYGEQITGISNDQQTRTSNIRAAVNDVESVLKDSPAILSKPEALSLHTRAAVAASETGSLRKALEAPFPSDHARMVKDSIEGFAVFLAGIEDTAEFKEWSKAEGNAKRYLDQKALLTQAKATLDPWLPGKPADVEAAAQQRKIAFWLIRFSEFSTVKIDDLIAGQPGKTNEDLALVVDTNCRTILGRGKSSSVSYTATDLFGTNNVTAPNVVKAVCQPLIGISGGLGFSSLGDQTPAFVSAKTEPTVPGGEPGFEQQFGYSEQSEIKPLFMVQTNVRLARARNGWAPVATLGVGATNRTDSTVVEFLVGGGVSIHGVAFLTAGLHFGKQPRIGGGFNEGDLKPAGLTAVPIDNGYRTAFAVSITFPLVR